MKDLHNGTLYWQQVSNLQLSFDTLNNSSCIEAEAVIIGGGMSGLLCAAVLIDSGIKPVIIEQHTIAAGSSSANTGLLQFCNDKMLIEFVDQLGLKKAQLFYQSCQNAIHLIENIAAKLPEDVCFIRRPSLYFASSEQHVPQLKKESEALRNCGLQVEYWDSNKIASHFPFQKPGAIYTNGDAEINPYHFALRLAEYLVSKGVAIYEHTILTKQEAGQDGKRMLYTESSSSKANSSVSNRDKEVGLKPSIITNHLVYAIGYEPEQLTNKSFGASLQRTYAIATEPVDALWHEHALIWETARPYFYMRTTTDNRIIAGGLDELIPGLLQNSNALSKKKEQLVHIIQTLLPNQQIKADYEWNAVFAESLDGLPFIGRDPIQKNVYYTLGYGGNGTVYSMLGAKIIRDLITGQSNPLAPITSLDR